MNWKAWGLFAALLFVVFATTGSTPDDIDRRLMRDPVAHVLQGSSYLTRASLTMVFDDAMLGFFDHAVPYADRLEEEHGVKFRFTTAAIPTNIESGAARIAPWNRLQAINNRQEQFEIALHSNADETMGSRRAAFSRAKADSSIKSWRNLFRRNGIDDPRSHILALHRNTNGLEQLWLENGIYQVGGLAVPVTADSATNWLVNTNEHSLMEVNSDPWPASSAGISAVSYWCYQRPGGIANRWNIGRRSSFTYATDTVDSLKKVVLLGIQTQSHTVLTFHDVLPDTTDANDLHILADDLYTFMDWLVQFLKTDDYQHDPPLEMLTFEQMADRGTSAIRGQIGNRWNFACLTDFAATVADSTEMVTLWPRANRVPISWPFDQSSGDFFASVAQDTMADRNAGGADSSNWKVCENGTQAGGLGVDTVAVVFGEESISDSTSYGASSASGRFLISASPDGNYSPAIMVHGRVTGARKPYVYVHVQMMVDNATSADGYVAAGLFPFREQMHDFVNRKGASLSGYDFTLSASKHAATLSNQVDWTASRLRPLFWIGVTDTTQWDFLDPTASATDWLTQPAESFVFGSPLLTPYVLDNNGTKDIKGPFGNYASWTDAGASPKSLSVKMDYFDADNTYDGTDYGNAIWKEAVFQVPIVPGVQDWVAGHVYLRRANSWTGSPTAIVSNFAVVIP